MIKLRLACLLALLCAIAAFAARPVGGAQAAAFDPEHPYAVKDDGTVDWYTYNGYRRYHSECHVCHGPDGLGSSFGPALADSLKPKSNTPLGRVIAARLSTRIFTDIGSAI